MEKGTTRIQVGEHSWRVTTTIVDNPGIPNDAVDLGLRQTIFLRLLADRPEMLWCGAKPFTSLTISHNGESWVARAEATEKTS